MKLWFVSKKRFEVGERVGRENGSLFGEQEDAIKHQIWSDGGGHVYEVEADRDSEGGTVTRWIGSASGVQMSQDVEVVFKDVPDQKELIGRLHNPKQNRYRAYSHNPNPKKNHVGKKHWEHSEKSDLAAQLEQIVESNT